MLASHGSVTPWHSAERRIDYKQQYCWPPLVRECFETYMVPSCEGLTSYTNPFFSARFQARNREETGGNFSAGRATTTGRRKMSWYGYF